MTSKNSLGKGLSALFRSDEEIDLQLEQEAKMNNTYKSSFRPRSAVSIVETVPEVPRAAVSEKIPETDPAEVVQNVHSSDLPEEETLPAKTEESLESVNPAESGIPEGQDESRQDESRIPEDQVVLMDIYQVEPDRNQPRKMFDPERLNELAASVKTYGILQPLLVAREKDYYRIIAGERRYRAARMAGLTQVPVIIREYTEEDQMAIALIENIQRQELNPMEEANAYQQLMEKHHMTQEGIAEKLNKSRSSIANVLRLRRLPDSVQKSISEGLLSFGHAKVLLGLSDPIEQTQLALQVISGNLSVRELEDLIHGIQKQARKKKTAAPPSRTLADRLVEERLKERLSTKVSVVTGARKGKIEIEYYSQDDLERILALLAP